MINQIIKINLRKKMENIKQLNNKLNIVYVSADSLRPSEYNPRSWSKSAIAQLKESIKRFGLVDPIIANSDPNRKNIVIGGHFRLYIAKELGIDKVPVVYLNIPDIEKEKELNLRLNKNVGEFDWDLLAKFNEEFLADVGFSSEELDEIFEIDETPEEFDLTKELAKLNIQKIEVEKGDICQLGNHKMMCGDSTNEKDVLELMNGEKADFCFTDPPYRLEYLKTKYKGKSPGFGYRRNRKYLETDELSPDFTERWMANIHKIQKEDFHIIVFENWKNLREIWGEMEKHWKVRNMIAIPIFFKT